MRRRPVAVLSFAFALAGVRLVLAAPGDLDPTFGGGGIVVTPIVGTNAQAMAVMRQTDGKLVAAGYANLPIVGDPDNHDFAVVRYDEDGTLDSTFGGTGIVTTSIRPGQDDAHAVIQQADGRIVVAGLSYDGTGFNDSTITVVRYLDDGTLDPEFGGGTGKVTTAVGPDYDGAFAVVQQSDLKLVVAGYSGTDVALVRYTTDGTLDSTFNGTGKVTTTVGSQATARALLLEAGDDKLVVAGISDTDVLLARYDTTGMPDATFAGGVVTKTVGSGAKGYALLQQASDGKLVVAGVADNGTNLDFLLLRYGLDGMPDGGFGTSGVAVTPIGSGNDSAYGLAQQADGALVAVGSSDKATNLDFALVRYDTSGMPDATFGTAGIVTTPIGTDEEAMAVLVQPNGGIVAAGYSFGAGSTRFALTRYLSLPGTTTSTSTTTTTSTTTIVTTTTTTSTVSPSSSTGISTTSTTVFVSSTTTTTQGSSTSTTTFIGTTTTSTLLLVPGGPAGKTSNDCFLELAVRGAVAPAVQKNQIVSCGDGSPCDQGPAGDGRCEVEIAVCALQTDPRLPDCTPPASLERVKVGKPFGGATSVLVGSNGPKCTAPARVVVPLKLSRSGKYLPGKSKVVIKGNATAPKGVPSRKDTDKWTIQCVPAGGEDGDGN